MTKTVLDENLKLTKKSTLLLRTSVANTAATSEMKHITILHFFVTMRFPEFKSDLHILRNLLIPKHPEVLVKKVTQTVSYSSMKTMW